MNFSKLLMTKHIHQNEREVSLRNKTRSLNMLGEAKTPSIKAKSISFYLLVDILIKKFLDFFYSIELRLPFLPNKIKVYEKYKSHE